MVRYCSNTMDKSKSNSYPRPKAIVAAEHPNINRFYALKCREEQEKSANIVIGTLHVFPFSIYASLDTGSTLSFVMPLIASRFYVLLDVLHELSLGSTPTRQH